MSTTSPTQTSTATATGTTGSSTASATANPLLSLSDNFQGFLQMLMTQLQNQDPTTPMDSTQFTSELVQFASVEQQISTNTNLTNLISLTQGNTMVESGQILGKQVQVTSTQLSLQNGTAGIAFTAPSAEPVAISITNAAGAQIYDTTVNAASGGNTWTWNGQTASGVTEPDGAYTVAVTTAGSGSTPTAVPFTVIGTATGVDTQGSVVNLDLGQLSVPMSSVTSVGN
jgi:flagellar basal-body rod modification protein FlgD